MKARMIQFGPTSAATNAGRVVLSPEMNAAVAARHSRTADGLDAILESIDKSGDEDKAIDSVFRFVDYGHRSIVDMIPVSIHIEGVSLFIVEFLWSLVHTGGGQETSTRYCRMSADDVYFPPEIPESLADEFRSQVKKSLDAYELAMEFWKVVSQKCPDLVGVTDGMDAKRAERFRRNFVFDRSRYFIPVVCRTNVNITTWATEWIRIVQALLSSPWDEARQIGQLVRNELELAAPRIVRHARFNEASKAVIDGQIVSSTLSGSGLFVRGLDPLTKSLHLFNNLASQPSVEMLLRSLIMHNKVGVGSTVMEFFDNALSDPKVLERDLGLRKNRYDPVGPTVSALPVLYSFKGVATAEIRDMNRHRPGVRRMTLRPEGFYFAEDQILSAISKRDHDNEIQDMAITLARTGVMIGQSTLGLAEKLLGKGLGSGAEAAIYSTNLGNTFSFTHSNTLGHLIYECELRTGPGVHYRYCSHYRELLRKIYNDYPLLKKFVLEGSGEPE